MFTNRFAAKLLIWCMLLCVCLVGGAVSEEVEVPSVPAIEFNGGSSMDVTYYIGDWYHMPIDIYVSNTDEPRKLRRKEDDIESVAWDFVMRVPMEKAEGWQDIEFPAPVQAKYVRFVLVDNHNCETTPETAKGWTETSEIKIYP